MNNRDNHGESLVSGVDYTEKLQNKFKELNRNTASWATLPDKKSSKSNKRKRGDGEIYSESDEEEEGDLLETNYKMTSASGKLLPNVIAMTR